MSYHERKEQERAKEAAAAGNPAYQFESKVRLVAAAALVVLSVFLFGWEVAIEATVSPCQVRSRERVWAGNDVVVECEMGRRTGTDMARGSPKLGETVYWSPLAVWGTRRTRGQVLFICAFFVLVAVGGFTDEWMRHERWSRNLRSEE